MKSKKIFFGLRLASVIVDISAIYCISALIQASLLKLIFVEFSSLFIVCFLFYYILCYQLLNGRTPGKVLTNIKIARTDGGDLRMRDIVLREIVLKGIAGILLPLYGLEYLIKKSPLIVFIIVFLFFVSVLILLIFKRQWWEIFSKTTASVKFISAPATLKRTFSFVTLITVAGIGVIIYPALKGNKKSFGTDFYPRYPTNGETKRYAAFIKSNPQHAVDYIFDLFKKYDIVVISERLHPEYTQYQLFSDIVKDKRFSKNIGNVFTECGSVSFQDTLDTYLHTSFASEDLLNKSTANLQRNSNAIWPLWDNTNLFDFFKTVNHLNRSLPDSSKINWYFTDTEVDWTNMTHAKFLKAYTSSKRDSLMAAHIIQKYKNIVIKQGRKKALVIMNSRHAYGLIPNKFDQKFRTEYNAGTTAYLMRELPGRVANVLMNTVSIKYSMVFTPVQHGKWETAFANAGNPDVGFNFSGSPFGDDEFDAAFLSTPGLTYKDVFTGFVFYKPLNQQIKKQGFPYEFTNFEDTILKRASYVDQEEVETYKSIIAYKKQQVDPVDSGMVPYALFSNVVVVIITPLLISISLLLAIFLFTRRIRKMPIA
jgi:uncharacterized RDD family membrane protein YckC